MNSEQAREKMRSILDSEGKSESCFVLYEYILKGVGVTHVTVGSAYHVLKGRCSHEDVFRYLWLLSSSPFNVLELRYELHDERTEEVIPLPRSMVLEAEEEGNLEHPLSGELIADYEHLVHMYFSPVRAEASNG